MAAEHDTAVNGLLKQATESISSLLKSYTFPNDSHLSRSVTQFEKLKIGDHLIYKCTNGWPVHFYVESIDNSDSVQVRSWFLQGNEKPLVEQELFTQPDQVTFMKLGVRTLSKDTIDVKQLCVRTYNDDINHTSEEERIKRSSTQHCVYDLLSNNSEHFLSFVKTGKAECQQFKPLEHAIVQQLIILAGRYGFVPTVLAAIRLGVMKSLAAFFVFMASRVVQKAIEKTTESVAHVSMIVVNISEKKIDQIAQEVAEEIIKALAQEISEITGRMVSKEVIQNSIEVLCREVLTAIVCQLAMENENDSGKDIADKIAKEGLDVVTRGIVKRGMESLAKSLLKKGIIELETDFFEYLEEEEATEHLMKEILLNSKMAVMEQLTDEAVKNSTTATAFHVAKNATKSNVTVGAVVEGVFYTAGMINAGQKYYKGEIDGSDFVEYTVEHTASAGGSLAGGIGGSLAGAAAGASIGSVLPVIGTTIGAGVGGFIGAMGGGVGGSLAGLGMGKVINWMWK